MIIVHTQDRKLTPLLLCDFCSEHLRGEGWLLVLEAVDGSPHLAEAFYTHPQCAANFEAQQYAPLGWRWWRVDLLTLIDLLAENIHAPREKMPVVKRPVTH